MRVSRIQTRRVSRIGARISSILMSFARTGDAYLDGVAYPANTPRFPSQSGTRGVMVEEAGTNLFLRSEPSSAAHFNSTSNLTYTASPGPFESWMVFANNSVQRFGYQNLALAVSTTYIISAYVMMDDGGVPNPSGNSAAGDFCFVVANTHVGTGLTSTHLGGGLYRVSGTYTTPGTIADFRCGIIKYTLQTTRGFQATALDIKAKTYLTSYVKATGAAATQGAETLTVPTAGLLTPSAGSVTIAVYVDGDLLPGTAKADHEVFNAWGNVNDNIRLYRAGTSWEARLRGSASTFLAFSAATIGKGWHIFTVRWSAAEASLWIDGVKRASALTPNIPTVAGTTMSIGCRTDGLNQLGQPIAYCVTHTRSLSDAEAASAGTFGQVVGDFTAHLDFTTGAIVYDQAFAARYGFAAYAS